MLKMPTEADLVRLEGSGEWASLTSQQRVWTIVFAATGSSLAATKFAYHTKSESNARVLSYEIRKNRGIVAALAVLWGIAPVLTERDRLIATVRRQLKAAEPGSVAASKFAAQLERLLLGGEPQKEETEISEPLPTKPKENSENPTSRVPVGAVALVDNDGVIRGYRTQDSQYVQLADVEVANA